MVVAKGEGDFYWEELEEGTIRSVDLSDNITCCLQSTGCTLDTQVVVAKSDGSFYWEELAEGANRSVDLSGDSLTVTCHMGGSTDVSSGGSSGGAGAAEAAGSPSSGKAEPASAIDMSVDMDAAKELNPAFNVQVCRFEGCFCCGSDIMGPGS